MTAPKLYRDQVRALHAYQSVQQAVDTLVTKHGDQRNDYRIAVDDLGIHVRRLGLAAALSQIEAESRKHPGPSTLLLDHLGKAGITGLVGTNATTIANRARGLDVNDYMLATRELLQVATWFRRAVQSLMPNTDAKA